MKERIEKLANWIDSLTLRERAFVLGAVILAVFLVWDRLLIEPLDKQGKQANAEVKKYNKELERIRQQQEVILKRATADPDAATKQEIQAIKSAMSSIDRRLKEMTVDLVAPGRMAQVLEEVLTRETNLKLVRVEALTPRPLTEEKQLDENSDKRTTKKLPGVYQHAMQIEFEGSYLETLKYIRELENLSQKFYWGSIDFSVEEYPRARVVITVNTLSLSEAWIGV